MRALPILLLCMTAAAGCAPETEPPPDAPPADTARVSLGRGATPYPASAADPASAEEVRDIGVGVLHFGARADSIGAAREDTVAIRNAPSDQAAIVARWIHRYGAEGVWEYRLETAEEGLLRNDIEWSYEENGLPVDTIAANGSWARVVYAADGSGDTRLGWARLSERMRLERWPDVLSQQNLFFRHPDSLAFFDAPDGAAVPLEITTGDTRDGLDYAIQPLRIVDEWMQVVVTTPSDYCVDPPDPQSDTTWIRFLDDRGRPRVWYYTRGC